MNAQVRFVVGTLAGHAVGEPFRVSLDTPGAAPKLGQTRAIYLAYTRCGELDYIGKADRARARAVARRLREHTRTSRRKRRVWRWLYVVPVADTLPERRLLDAERAAIVALRPPGNVQNLRRRVA